MTMGCHTPGERPGPERSGAAEVQDDLGVVAARDRRRFFERSDPDIVQPQVAAQPIRSALLTVELVVDHGLRRLDRADKTPDTLITKRLEDVNCRHQAFTA
jgi:hypothetical protein